MASPPPSFLFRIDDIEPTEEADLIAMKIHNKWQPPKRRHALKTVEYGTLSRWHGGVVTAVAVGDPAYKEYDQPSQVYSAATLFINHCCYTFAGMDCDARVRNGVFVWTALGFSPRAPQFRTGDGTLHRLTKVVLEGDLARPTVPGGHIHWVQQLFPQRYHHMADEAPPPLPACNGGLIGDPAVILALVAFSADRDKCDSVLAQSMRGPPSQGARFGSLGSWVRHSFTPGCKLTFLQEVSVYSNAVGHHH
ncbi:hypothetical protein MMC25_004083 [Agyrium rufum]|nr:hypothetical protein [Agyrium rufum]